MMRGYVAVLRPRVCCIAFLLMSLFAQHCLAQRVEDSCHAFFDDRHQALDCAEALFTQTDIPHYLPHLTVSSIPPGNGFPIGVVYEKRTNYVSSPFNAQGGAETPTQGHKSLVDAKAALVGSTNASWYATGSITWLPPLPYKHDTKSNGEDCHRLGPLCTKSVLGIGFSVTHRDLQTISFYGLGPSSPNTQFLYRQRETYGGVTTRLPLLNWLTVEGELENRKPAVTFRRSSLSTSLINETTAPGSATQPDFMHYAVGLRSQLRAVSEPTTNDPAIAPPSGPQIPLIKHKLIFLFDNAVSNHWFIDQGTGHYSFRQFVIQGEEAVQLHSVIRRFVPPGQMTTKLRVLKHFCNQRKSGLKQDDECDFGEFVVRPLLELSAANGGIVPFYLQPTLGGSDIESRLTLRGFNNYRFRAPNAAMLGVDYRIAVFDPIGAVLFYDAGSVGNSTSGLSFAHARQDAGIGATLRIQKNVIAQVYLAFGASHGSHPGYNFTKFF